MLLPPSSNRSELQSLTVKTASVQSSAMLVNSVKLDKGSRTTTAAEFGGRGSISTNASGKTACPDVKNGIRSLPLTQLKSSRAGDFLLRLFFGVGTQLHPSLGFRPW